MAKRTYSKTHPETEIEKIRRLFPNYDNTPLEAEYFTDGKIKKLVTNNIALQAIMKNEGFTES